MQQITIGIREFKNQLRRYLEKVKAGTTLVITKRGTPVARLVPEASFVGERLHELVTTHQVAWSGRRLRPALPSARQKGAKTVAQIVVEDREGSLAPH